MELAAWVLVLSMGMGSVKGGISTEQIPINDGAACRMALENFAAIATTWNDNQFCLDKVTGKVMIYSEDHRRVLVLPEDIDAPYPEETPEETPQ